MVITRGLRKYLPGELAQKVLSKRLGKLETGLPLACLGGSVWCAYRGQVSPQTVDFYSTTSVFQRLKTFLLVSIALMLA